MGERRRTGAGARAVLGKAYGLRLRLAVALPALLAVGLGAYVLGATGSGDSSTHAPQDEVRAPLQTSSSSAVPSLAPAPTPVPTMVPPMPASPAPQQAQHERAPVLPQQAPPQQAVAPLQSTPVPPPPPASAPEPAAATGSGCVTNCGEPRFFCDSGGWAFCDDYRDVFCPIKCDLAPLRASSVSIDALDASDPGYVQGGLTENGTHVFGNDQEHFHTIADSGNFGMTLVRFKRPIDLSSERHIHFDVDMKVEPREYIRFLLSPQLTKRLVDDRGDHNLYPNTGLDVWLNGGGVVVKNYRNGEYTQPAWEGDAGVGGGTDNVRDHIDVWVSRTNLRIAMNGEVRFDRSLPDIGFGTAYLYLAQVSYNPCKDGLACDANSFCMPSACTFHWDNVAYDGPVLPANGLTPVGDQDVVFNVYGSPSCTVKGVVAVATGEIQPYTWFTYVARMPAQPVSVSDIQCDGADAWDGSIHGFEIVSQ